jgi:hypothetical protein
MVYLIIQNLCSKQAKKHALESIIRHACTVFSWPNTCFPAGERHGLLAAPPPIPPTMQETNQNQAEEISGSIYICHQNAATLLKEEGGKKAEV